MKRRLQISLNAPVVLWFAMICAAATLLNYLTKGAVNQVIFSTYHSSIGSPLTYLRFLTHVFGHVDWAHLVGNMTYLLLLGPMLEEKYGSKALVEVIIITAVVTAVANYIFFPMVALCGASGVVFAFILMSSFTSFKEGEIPLTFILVVAFFIGREIIDGIFVTDQISNLAHIVGGIVGSLIGYGLNVKSRHKSSY